MAPIAEKRGRSAAAAKSPAGRQRGRVAVRLKEAPKSVVPVALDAENRRRPGKRGADVRERILKVALEYFGAFGFEGTTTRAVAERAGVTHSLVLYHYQSKDMLWIATVEDALEGYRESLSSNIATAPECSARDALARFIEQFVRMSACHPQIHRMMTMDSTQDSKRLDWVIEHFLRDHFTFVRDLIRRGQAEGSVRQCDPARLYYLMIGACSTPFTLRTEYRALTGRDVFSEAEILRNIAFVYEMVLI